MGWRGTSTGDNGNRQYYLVVRFHFYTQALASSRHSLSLEKARSASCSVASEKDTLTNVLLLLVGMNAMPGTQRTPLATADVLMSSAESPEGRESFRKRNMPQSGDTCELERLEMGGRKGG